MFGYFHQCLTTLKGQYFEKGWNCKKIFRSVVSFSTVLYEYVRIHIAGLILIYVLKMYLFT